MEGGGEQILDLGDEIRSFSSLRCFVSNFGSEDLSLLLSLSCLVGWIDREKRLFLSFLSGNGEINEKEKGKERKRKKKKELFLLN